MFANNDSLAETLLTQAEQDKEYFCRLPLHQPYKAKLKSSVADLSNIGTTPHGGPITAALFLQHFVASKIDWFHFDVTGQNTENRPGRPKGGEVFGLRTVFNWLQKKYQN